MKKYYIIPGNFVNAYNLFWVTDEGYYPNAENYKRKFNTAEFLAEYPNAEQISRKQAIAYTQGKNVSGYVDRYVHPYGAAWYDPAYAYLHTDSTGVIVE